MSIYHRVKKSKLQIEVANEVCDKSQRSFLLSKENFIREHMKEMMHLMTSRKIPKPFHGFAL